jgi:hypothetical protein
LKDGKPLYEGRVTATVYLESVDGSRRGSTIMAGDRVRIKSTTTNSVVKIDDGDRAYYSEFFVLHYEDNPHSPSRVGEYILEDDKVSFFTGQLGAPDRSLHLNINGRYLTADRIYSNPVDLILMRCDVSED